MSERTYDDNVKIWKKAYEEVAEVCGKYSKEFERYASDFGDIKEMEYKAKNHLMLIEWYEKYGLNKRLYYSSNYGSISLGWKFRGRFYQLYAQDYAGLVSRKYRWFHLPATPEEGKEAARRASGIEGE